MTSTPPDAKPPEAVRQDDDQRPERLALSVEEASDLLGISKWLGYEMVAQGILPALRLGRRLVVPRVALERMLEEVAHVPSGLESRRVVN
jgi:excisionase family DNA binding protein